MENNENNAPKRKYKPAGINANPKICGAQIIKGREHKLEALSAKEHKSSMPKEIQEGMTIPVYKGGYEKVQDRVN